jgi:ribosomal protein L5
LRERLNGSTLESQIENLKELNGTPHFIHAREKIDESKIRRLRRNCVEEV